jgi:hypothetical protein
LHEPEAQRQSAQVFTNTAGERSIHQEGTSNMDRLFDPIGCIQIVACDIAPDFEEVDRLAVAHESSAAWGVNW